MTLVFLACLVGVSILVNLPGQVVVTPDIFADGKYGPHFGITKLCEHGWPFTYLRREGQVLNVPPYWRLSPWRVAEGVVLFDAPILILDILISLVITSAAAFVFEQCRRRRQGLLQFYVRDMFILSAVMSVAAAVYVFHRSQHASERNILRLIEDTKDPNGEWGGTIDDRVDWRPGGSSWLRQIVGDPPFHVFDRVVSIEAAGVQLKHVVQLRELKVMHLYSASQIELYLLEELPQLEALDMCYANFTYEGQEEVDAGEYPKRYFQLPRMPKLRGLNLYGTSFRGEGLENIPSVEVLEVTETDVDDDSIPALSLLTNLKKLSLYDTAISDSGLKQLRKALPDCEILR